MCAFQESREPLRIYLTHAPEMSPEVSFGDEIAKHGLFKQRCVAARHRDCCGHVIHHVERNHQVSEPQRRSAISRTLRLDTTLSDRASMAGSVGSRWTARNWRQSV